MKTPIVIPLHQSGGKHGDDTELRYALRSLAAYLTDPHEIAIVGPRLPSWIRNVRHIQQENAGLKTALKLAADAYPEGFLWYYDDTCLLRQQSAAALRVTTASAGWRRQHQTGWSKSLEEVRKRLVAEGIPPWDYSRPHGPYWFDKSMIDEAFEDWPGMKTRFPFESWILSKRRWPRRHGVTRQYYGPFTSPPDTKAALLNYNNAGLTSELLEYLHERFPRPGPHEDDHPVAWPEEIRKVEVHTIRFGDSWWLAPCVATLDRWCAKHRHPLRVWTKEDIPADYPTEKFCEVDMLREFLAGSAEWLFYVDADVYVADHAPPHPAFDGLSGFLIQTDPPGKFSRQWPGWVRKRFTDATGIRHRWIYRNAGVWACDRAAAETMLSVIEPPYRGGCQEQHHWNWWLALGAEAGMPVHELPQGWNNFPHQNDKAAFYHLCGRKKAAKWNSLVARGHIPPLIPDFPFMKTFDLQKYDFTRHTNGWDTDDFHIHLLHAAACLDTGKPPEDKVAVEVGSFRGRSTAALIEALNMGRIGMLHIVEIHPTESLRQVIAMCAHPDRVKLHTKPYWDTDIGPVDFAFIDGDHKWPAVGDTMRALASGVKVLCMHDTQADGRISGTWGSRIAADMVRDWPGRRWFEDAVDREGLRTFRGFMVSVAEGIDLAPVLEAAGHVSTDDEAGCDAPDQSSLVSL